MNHPTAWGDRRASVGVESMASAAPPYYTTQRDGHSPAPLAQPTAGTQEQDDDDDSSEQGSQSMHSCVEDLSDAPLPSPHSVEDLSGTDSRQDDDATTIAHGYTFPGADRSDTTASPPSTSESHLSSNGTISARRPPGPYSHETRTRYARHYSTPTSPSASYGVLAQSMGTAEAGTPPTMYHHRPSSQPAGIGQMTYRQNRIGQDSVDGHARGMTLQQQPPPMASTATFLPDGQPPPQFRSHADLSTALHAQHASTDTQASTTSTAVGAPPGRAANYVSLSRRSTVKKTGFFRQTAVSSSITGTFTIDPSLHIAPALLKALETPSALVTDLFPGMRPKDAPARRPRAKNLHLEVENGGIDVDVHLVPPPRDATRRMTIGARPLPSRPAAPSPPPPVVRPTSAQRMSFERSGMSEESWVRAGNPRPSARSRSIDIQPTARASPVPDPKFPTTTHAGPTPTLIDLRLKEARSGRTRKGGGASKKKGTEFALVARVHAPHPRPPFHLLASTVDIIPYAPSAQPHTGIPPPDPQATAPPRPRPPRRPAPVPYSRSPSRAPLTLAVPRTFRGPLTVHVGVGDLDAHVRLSPGMAAAAVVLAETAYARGFFVGKLTADDGRAGLGRGWALGAGVLADEKEDGCSPEGEPELGGEEEGEPAEREEDEEEVWVGDKIDVFVGGGVVYLQLLGEENAFRKPGFWSRLTGRR